MLQLRFLHFMNIDMIYTTLSGKLVDRVLVALLLQAVEDAVA